MVGPGDVDPVPTLPLCGGDHGRMESPGVLDGGSAVTENLSDTDLVEDDAGRAEGGEPVIGVGAEPGGGGGGLADVLSSGMAVTVDGCGIGGDLEQSAVHRDRKSTRLNSSHVRISYAVFCLKKKKRASAVSLLQQRTDHKNKYVH